MVSLRAVEAMREVGYDLSAHASKPLAEIPDVEYDLVVTMGCGDACPSMHARRRMQRGGPRDRGSRCRTRGKERASNPLGRHRAGSVTSSSPRTGER